MIQITKGDCMTTFVSLMDVVNDDLSITPVKEDIINMKAEAKAMMDKGLTPDEMQGAKLYYDAILGAEEILDKIANKQ